MHINLAEVASVYQGKKDACCCGCAGSHRYASKHRDWASKDRGYKVTDDEVNDTTVLEVVNTIKALGGEYDETDHFFATEGDTVYIAYMKG